MTEKSFQIRNYSFDQKAINNLAVEDHLEENWPALGECREIKSQTWIRKSSFRRNI